jgi:hypothetical protein
MTAPQADGGSLHIPAADGYHYADDHPWDSDDQAALTDAVWDAVEYFRQEEKDVPVFSSTQTPSAATTSDSGA